MSMPVFLRRFPWAFHATFLTAALAFAVWPIVSVVLAIVLADANGCEIGKMAPQPCPVLGLDIGGLLYAMKGLSWLAVMTLPLGGGALIAWTAVFLIHLLAWRRFRLAA
ncbi:MAG TPA: hypothetical protein VGN79_03915 [Devosia sp.]|nr:hypothetical protein [Devosia sp.]